MVIDNDKDTITVYGNYEIDDVLDEIYNCGLDYSLWTIQIIPQHVWTSSYTFPNFIDNYEIKA